MIDARLVYEVSIGDMGPRHVSHWGMSAGSARVTIAVVVTGVSCCCEDEPQQQSPQQPGIRNRTDQQQLSLSWAWAAVCSQPARAQQQDWRAVSCPGVMPSGQEDQYVYSGYSQNCCWKWLQFDKCACRILELED